MMSVIRLLGFCLVIGVGVGGCAASVKMPDKGARIAVGSEASAALVLNMTGCAECTTSKDWEEFKGVWRQSLKDDAAASGISFSSQEGDAKSTGDPGTLLVVDIADYRFLSPGARFAFGVMTGNAYINATVTFRDLKSGDTWGSRKYDTSSTAWQGIFSAMTEKQVQAISKQIIVDLTKH